MIPLKLLLSGLVALVSLASALPGAGAAVAAVRPAPSPEPALPSIAQLRRPGHRRFLDDLFSDQTQPQAGAGAGTFRQVKVLTRTLDSSMRVKFLNNKLPRAFHHWAVHIGSNVYELNHGVKSGSDYNIYVVPFSQWKARGNTKSANQFFEVSVGYTKWPDAKIQECGTVEHPPLPPNPFL